MNAVWLLLLFVIGGGIAIVTDRRIGKLKAENQKDPNSESIVADASASNLVTQTIQRATDLVSQFRKQPQPDLTPGLRAWCVKTFANQPEKQAWFNTLSDDAFRSLTNHVTEFCKELGMELNWLVDPQQKPHPTVQAALTSIVKRYSEACYDAVVVQEDLAAWKSWQAFDQNPYGKEQQPFVQMLFDALLEARLTPMLTPEQFKLSEVERQIYKVQVIRQFAEQNPSRLHQVIKVALTMPARSAEQNSTPSPATQPVEKG